MGNQTNILEAAIKEQEATIEWLRATRSKDRTSETSELPMLMMTGDLQGWKVALMLSKRLDKLEAADGN